MEVCEREINEENFGGVFFPATSSAQWYQWNAAQPTTRICADCWSYYKKMGGVKYPKKSGEYFPHHSPIECLFSGPDRRQGEGSPFLPNPS